MISSCFNGWVDGTSWFWLLDGISRLFHLAFGYVRLFNGSDRFRICLLYDVYMPFRGVLLGGIDKSGVLHHPIFSPCCPLQ